MWSCKTACLLGKLYYSRKIEEAKKYPLLNHEDNDLILGEEGQWH